MALETIRLSGLGKVETVIAAERICLTPWGAAVPGGHAHSFELLVCEGGSLDADRARGLGITPEGRLPADWEARMHALRDAARGALPPEPEAAEAAAPEPEAEPASGQAAAPTCAGTTKAGKACRSTTLLENGYCRGHQDQTPPADAPEVPPAETDPPADPPAAETEQA